MTAAYETRWDLDSLYPHPESGAFQTLLRAFETDLRHLADDSEGLPAGTADAEEARQWADFLERHAALHARFEDLRSFVGCHAADDAANREFQRLEGVLAGLEPLRAQVLTNLELALRDRSPAELDAWLARDERLARMGFFVHECRRNGTFRLPKEQELLAADLDVDGRHAWARLYDRLSGALRIQVMEKGELVQKSPGQVQFDSAERSVRQNNFFAAAKAWNTLADSCADALNHISGSRLTRYRRLGLQDHLDWPLRLNRMRRETLETMWAVVSEYKPIVRKYLLKKAELLGLERLAWYDVQAPLPEGPAPGAAAGRMSYDQACETVIRTFREFSEELGDFAERALTSRWIEAEDRPGKRQGGFCTPFPTKQQSRIFMTFTHSADSMSTLAHELGHAYHSHVLREQPLLLQEYPMNLAETASTFAEEVLNERRMADAASDQQRLSLLDKGLADAVAFLMNIHARFLFEDRFHHERREGELSADRFSELMHQAQREAYADSLAEDGWSPGFWISKLHFYISTWPFYNFPYTFGYLLSLGLYRVRGERPDFGERYRRLLIATGSKESEQAVAETFGYDISQPDFWRQSLSVVEGRVQQFLALAG